MINNLSFFQKKIKRFSLAKREILNKEGVYYD
jgi:hypothetical protein